MEFEISDLEANNMIYFSEDGINFSLSNSVFLNANVPNRFAADPENYFLFQTDLLHGDAPVGDGEICARCSDWHERILLDGEAMFVPSPLMFRKVKKHLKKAPPKRT